MGSNFTGSSSQRQQSASGTKFPWEFIGAQNKVLGRPFTVQEIMGSLPQTQSLFGGAQTQQPQAQQAQASLTQPFQPTSTPQTTAPAGALGQQVQYGAQQGQNINQALTGNQTNVADIVRATAQNQQPQAGLTSAFQQPAAAPTTAAPAGFSLQEAIGALPQERHSSYRANWLTQAVKAAGLDPANLTTEGLQAALKSNPRAASDPNIAAALASLQAQEQVTAASQEPPRYLPQTPSTTAGLEGALPGGIAGGLANVGIGQVPKGVESAFAPQGFDAMQQAIYQSQFQPQQIELQRQAGLQDRALAGQLGKAGLASSGAGIGQRAQQGEEYGRRMSDASQQAANQAAAQRYGLEYQQAEGNAERQQQANLAAQQSFLSLLNIQEADLARMDQAQLNNLQAMFDAYLKQLGIYGGIGQWQTSSGNTSSKPGLASIAGDLGQAAAGAGAMLALV